MFIKHEENKFQLVHGNPQDVLPRLKSGMYDMVVEETPWSKHIFFQPNNSYKKGKKIDCGIYGKIREFFEDFISDDMEKARNEMGMLSKMGMIFTGDPGTGKTFLAGQLAQDLCDKRQAIGVLTSQYSRAKLHKIIDDIRENDPDQWIILILDEFEKVIKDFDDSDLLGFLDGRASRDKVITIAIVNSTKKLPDHLTKRPGRFEKIFRFKADDEDVLNTMTETVIPDDYRGKLKVPEIVQELKGTLKDVEVTIDAIRLKVRDKITNLIRSERKKLTAPTPVVTAA